jgi:hypothetical protein
MFEMLKSIAARSGFKMRFPLHSGIALLMLSVMASTADATPRFPKAAVALEAQLLASQNSDAKAWIKEEAEREAVGRILSEETPRSAARKFGSSGSEVSQMAFLVLMQASRDADANVSEIVNNVQGAGASQADVRQQTMRDNDISGSQQAQFSSGAQTAQSQQGNTFLHLDPTKRTNDPIGDAIRGAVPGPTPIAAPTMTLQDAMDRQSLLEDLVAAALKRAQGE